MNSVERYKHPSPESNRDLPLLIIQNSRAVISAGAPTITPLGLPLLCVDLVLT